MLKSMRSRSNPGNNWDERAKVTRPVAMNISMILGKVISACKQATEWITQPLITCNFYPNLSQSKLHPGDYHALDFAGALVYFGNLGITEVTLHG